VNGLLARARLATLLATIVGMTAGVAAQELAPAVGYGPPDEGAVVAGVNPVVVRDWSSTRLPEIHTSAPASRRHGPVLDPAAIVATDSRGVEEPVVISLLQSGRTHTVTAFIRRLAEEPDVAFNVRDSWVYHGSDGGMTTGVFTLPPAYTNSSDPVLAHNGTTGGVAPQRTYLVGRALNRGPAPALAAVNPTSIRVWMSVNGGASWTDYGSEVDSMAGGNQTVDKPWIAVSQVGKTAGYVYVSWIRLDMTNRGGNELMFRRSRNGVSRAHAVCCFPPTWDAPIRVTDVGRVQGPQIVVDNAGYVYIIFADVATHEMRIARSRFPGANVPSDGSSVFLPAQTIATYNRINRGGSSNVLASSIRVVPLPAAHYSSASNEILVAWTEGETDQGVTVDVRLFRVSADTAMQPVAVPLSTEINSPGANQFTPAIESDETGAILLAYYDSRGLSESEYRERVAKLSATGALLSSTFPDVNPTPLGSVCTGDFVGEYQGVSRRPEASGGGFDLAWTCSSAANRTIVRAAVQ
jgi:hypothetical protein